MAYQAVDEIMTRCEKDGVEFWKAVQLEDCEENGISEEESWKQMTLMWTRIDVYKRQVIERTISPNVSTCADRATGSESSSPSTVTITLPILFL